MDEITILAFSKEALKILKRDNQLRIGDEEKVILSPGPVLYKGRIAVQLLTEKELIALVREKINIISHLYQGVFKPQNVASDIDKALIEVNLELKERIKAYKETCVCYSPQK